MQPPQLSAIAPQPEHSSLQKSTSIQSQSLSASDRSLSREEEEALTINFAIGKINDYFLLFLWVLEITLMLRFMLKLIGADPTNLFAGYLYILTDYLTFPFLGIVKSPSIHPPNQAFEFSTLIAMATYFLVFFALRRLLRFLIRQQITPKPSISNYRNLDEPHDDTNSRYVRGGLMVLAIFLLLTIIAVISLLITSVH